MKELTKDNASNLLIGINILLLVMLLLSDWTDLFGNLRNITIAREIDNWLKVISYFPIIWTIQIFALKLEKYYSVSIIYFSFYFFLNGYVLINQAAIIYPVISINQIVLQNLVLKTVEQFMLGSILYLTITITLIQKTSNAFHNKPKEIS
ncbi:MAG: hypothetical protein GXO87_09725 [Chlorobi bacterium]|nr:hypothetical protein [Chlorobiota bacterium]